MNKDTETKEASAAKDTQPKTTPTSSLEAVEDDDEFEEFEPNNWAKGETEDESQQWMENWDDVTDKDDFIKTLRAELEKSSASK